MSNQPITITRTDEKGWTVIVGRTSCPHLGWDEMLGQIVALTHQSIGKPHYPMLTDAEHEERERRREERMESMHAADRAEAERKRDAVAAMADALRQWACAERTDDGAEFANAQAARDAALDRASTVGLA